MINRLFAAALFLLAFMHTQRAHAASFEAQGSDPAQNPSIQVEDLGPGSLVLTLHNRLPIIDVPAPHLPTVFHLQAEICAENPRGPAPRQIRPMLREGLPAASARHPASCLVMTLPIFSGTSQRFVIPAEQLHAMSADTHGHFAIRLRSSGQISDAYFPCIDRVGRWQQSQDPTTLDVSVVEQTFFGFVCRLGSKE